MKLLSMTDFVLHLRGMTTTELCEEYPKAFKLPTWNGNIEESVKDFLAIDARLWKMVGDYAKFLKQPLKLEMFVPCDEEGNVLEEPEFYREWISELEKGIEHEFDSACMKHFRKAKEKVLFEGFEVKNNFEGDLVLTQIRKNQVWSHIDNRGFKMNYPHFGMRFPEKIEELVGGNLTLTSSALNQLNY